MDVALVLLRDQADRRRFALPNDVTTIGRSEACDLRIPLGEVSRRHCSIVQSEGQVLVQDLGSSNGTYVNGKRIQETPLRPGDQIRIGSFRFIVQIDGKPAEGDPEFTAAAEQTAPETRSARPPKRPEEPAIPSPSMGEEEPAPSRSAPADEDDDLVDIFKEDDDWP